MARLSLDRLKPSARKVCLVVLRDVERGAPVQLALSRTLDGMEFTPAARRQATDLVYCCLRARLRCQYILGKVFPRFERFAPEVRHLLLAACTALLFEDYAPAYAVVHETVGDIHTLAGKGIAGAANGGLRSLLRMGGAPMEPDFYHEPGDRDDFVGLCRLCSFPENLGRLLLKECGEERTTQVMIGRFSRPAACVRLNRTRPDWQTLRRELLDRGASPLSDAADEAGLAFMGGVPQDVHLAGLAGEGRLSLQSAGSQLALAAMEFDPAARVWDACCGFGGKTTALLERGLDVCLASDISRSRALHLPQECTRLGLNPPMVMLSDGARQPLTRFDGTILLDVPCSGLGVLARRPDIKLRQRNLKEYVNTQRRLLEQAVLLAQRGRDVIYMTCTVTRSENGSMVRSVCSDYDVRLADEWSTPRASAFECMYAARIRI